MFKKFAVEMLNDVADECESRACSYDARRREVLAMAAEKITDIVEMLSVESAADDDHTMHG